MDSILTSIKKVLGITEEYTQFDVDIIMAINSAFAVLTQLGVGPSEGFIIKDKTATWSDFINDNTNLEFAKTYVHLKTKLVFDSSSHTSAELESINRMVTELEWRLNVAAESKQSEIK